MKILLLSLLILSGASSAYANHIDCSEAYGGESATCERISCDEKYLSFLGAWSGPFQSYSRELSNDTKTVFRPFDNTITYSESDCLRNIVTGDTFIIGRKTDVYPAFSRLPGKTITGLLITGKSQNGSPFLRTFDAENGRSDYKLEYQNRAANLSIWTLVIPATEKSPEMRFETIDGQDFSETSVHRRNVVVTMSVGPASKPLWEGVIAKGFHSLTKSEGMKP